MIDSFYVFVGLTVPGILLTIYFFSREEDRQNKRKQK